MATQAITVQQSAPPQVHNPAKDVRALIMSSAFQDQIKKAMPEAMSSDVLLRVAVTTIQKNPLLLECTQQSLMQCVLECAQLGLLPDGILGQAYMIPYKDTRAGVRTATLQIGYRGIIKLAKNSNEVKYVVGEAVYACDKFKIEYAPVRSISHVPDIDNEHRGEVKKGNYLPEGFRGAYGLVIYKDDTIDFEYMPLHKIERIRASSQSGSKADAPWLNHFEEMAKKTAIRSLGKRLPLSADDLRRIVQDEYREAGIDVGYTVDASITDSVRDVESEFIMDALTWNEARKGVARRNFTNDRDGLLAYVKKEAAKAGLSLDPPKQEVVAEAEQKVAEEKLEATEQSSESLPPAQEGSEDQGVFEATDKAPASRPAPTKRAAANW